MDMVLKNGRMGLNTLVNGNLTRPVVRVNSGMLMETYLKGNGLMIKQMASEYILIKMVLNMKDHGRMIYNMAMARNLGLMAQSMKENILKVKNMDKGIISGMMDQNMMGNGQIIK